MVILEDALMEDDGEVEMEVIMMDKIEKAHSRPIMGLWSFRYGGKIGIVTVAHDSAKLWVLEEDRHRKNAKISGKATLAKYRPAVHSADVSRDGKALIVVGIDSIVHEISLDNLQQQIQDLGYMETIFATIAPENNVYLTSSYTGYLKEIELGSDRVVRKEPFQNVKGISCLKYSYDMKYIAIGQNDGVIDIFDVANLKLLHKFEVHSMKVRKIEFLPGDEKFLSACDDRLIKLHSLTDMLMSETNRTMKAARTYAAHNGPIYALTVDERSGGTRFASASSTAQIFIWHIEMATPISVVANEHEGLITGLSFSPSGRHLLSAGEDTLICCYKVPASDDSSPYPEDEDQENVGYYDQTGTNSQQEYYPEHADNTKEYMESSNVERTQYYGENPQGYEERVPEEAEHGEDEGYGEYGQEERREYGEEGRQEEYVDMGDPESPEPNEVYYDERQQQQQQQQREAENGTPQYEDNEDSMQGEQYDPSSN